MRLARKLEQLRCALFVLSKFDSLLIEGELKFLI
jgi:hypothetical protein